MQHFSLQGRLLWLFLPAVAMAIQILRPGSTPAGKSPLNLISLQNLTKNHPGAITCTKDVDPDRFTTSLPTDFPPDDSGSVSFDCYVNFADVVGFDIDGSLASDLDLNFKATVVVLGVFKYPVGDYHCSLVKLDSTACTFDVNVRVMKGQAAIYPQEDAKDPSKLHLCLKIAVTFHVWYKHIPPLNVHKCFATLDKPDDIAIDALIPEPDLSNSTVATT